MLMKEEGIQAPFWVVCGADTITIMVCVCMSLAGSFEKEWKTEEDKETEKLEKYDEEVEEEMQRAEMTLLR